MLDDDALEIARAFSQTRLACGKTLIELSTYNDVAMWWFADADFYYFLDALLNGRAIYDVWRHKVRRVLSRIEFLGVVLQKSIARVIVSLSQRKEARHDNRLPVILFTAQDWQWRVVRHREAGRFRKSDVFFDSIIEKLQGKCDFVGVGPPMVPYPAIGAQISRWRVFVDKLLNWDIPQRAFESYWSLDCGKTECAATEHFRRMWSILSRDYKLQESLGGTDVGRLTKAKLEYYFHVSFPRAVRYVEMSKRMIREENPELVLVLNETGFFERALIVAAKQLRVPTLAIQHGAISRDDKGYVYRSGEISSKGSAVSPFCPIPDKTAMYGPYYKHLLTRFSAYPEDRVIVTGQPRYDRLAQVKWIYSRARFLRRYRIPSDQKILLWTTQSHGLAMEENVRNLRTVLGTMKDLEKTALIIRQHPGESRVHTEMIKRFLLEYKTNTILTTHDSDLYEQLYSCDLMISKHSTTIVEAVALNKPVIVLNLTGEILQEGSDYVEEGVALEVNEEQELGPVIRRLLADDSKLSRNRKKFLEKYLYKLDGKATERVVDLIWEMTAGDHHSVA